MPFVTFRNRNILFVHIPKTGGTTVTDWMGQAGPVHLNTTGLTQGFRVRAQHLRHLDIAELFAPDFFDYRFTIVRNPYDRIASEYRFRAANHQNAGQVVPSFSAWLDRNLARAAELPHHLDNHLLPQTAFLGSGVQVFRYEDGLEAALHAVSRDTGLPAPDTLPHRMSKGHEFTPPEWDLQDRLMVNRHFAEDFRHLGYEMVSD